MACEIGVGKYCAEMNEEGEYICPVSKEKCPVSRDVITGAKYKHFKGHTVRVIAIAKHTETEEMLVVYEYDTGEYFARPYSMFVSEVDHEKYPDVKQKYRFELIK